MLTYAVIIFAVTAVGGLGLASFILRGKLAPWALSLIHAAAGAAGLVLTGLAFIQGAGSMIGIALALLVVAALAGFYLASLHLRKQIAPSGAVIAHAGVAVVGFLLLTGAVFGLF